MLKKDLEQKIKNLEGELDSLYGKNVRLRKKVEELESEVASLGGSVQRRELKEAYTNGQVEVLKRISGLYEEEKQTREEYKEFLKMASRF